MGARTRGIANNILSDGLDATDGLSGALSSDNIANASVTNVTSTPSIGGGFEKLASDPPSPTEGDIWYNTTSNTVKGYVFAAGSWATGGNLSTARRATWGAGTQTAGLIFGGYIGPTISGATEEYNGSSWTAGGSLGQERYHLAGTGTQTAGLAFGGSFPSGANRLTATEEYNGSSWTSGGNLGTARYVLSGGGVQDAAFAFGGTPLTPPTTNATEEYNGSSWTAGGNYPISINGSGGCGTLTAGLGCGGAGDSSVTAEYDGSAWTAVNNTLYGVNGGFATGTQTDSILSGGSPEGVRSSAQIYDGTSWTATGSLSNGRYTPAGSSLSGSAALSMGGGGGTGATPTGNNVATEEFSGAGAAIKTLG